MFLQIISGKVDVWRLLLKVYSSVCFITFDKSSLGEKE